MRLHRIMGGWLLGGIAIVSTGLAADTRTWHDSTGSFSVEAELISVSQDSVVLRKGPGKVITVPLEKLSEADRKYLRDHPPKLPAASPAPSLKAKATSTRLSLDQSRVRELTELFYDDLKTKERHEAYRMLTDAAKAIVDDGKSPLNSLPVPDATAKSIKVGKSKIVGSQAMTPVQVRFGGMTQSTILHFRKIDDDWFVFAVSAKLGMDEVTINFEETLASRVDKQDPLAALLGQTIEVSGLTLDGQAVSSSNYTGKVVLIDFWATWCGPCRKEIPNILENYQKYRGAGFDVIAVSVDRDLDELRSFVIEERPPWVVLADNHPENKKSMGSKFRISGIPAFILVGKDGKVVDVDCRGERLGMRLAQLLGN